MNSVSWVVLISLLIIGVTAAFMFLAPEENATVDTTETTTTVNTGPSDSTTEVGMEASVIVDTADLEDISNDTGYSDLEDLEEELDIPNINMDLSIE